MPRKKSAPLDIARDRKVIADSLIDGCVLSTPYTGSDRYPSATLVDVLTERGGAEACEYVLPETAKAIVAAFGPGGWSASLDEIERLRGLIDEACSIGNTLAEDAGRVESVVNRETRLKAIRREAGL